MQNDTAQKHVQPHVVHCTRIATPNFKFAHLRESEVCTDAGGATTAADGTKLWKLGTTGLKHASLGEFKGTRNIGLREYYEKDGLRPGKKGINLSVDQFTNLVNNAEVWQLCTRRACTLSPLCTLRCSQNGVHRPSLKHWKRRINRYPLSWVPIAMFG